METERVAEEAVMNEIWNGVHRHISTDIPNDDSDDEDEDGDDQNPEKKISRAYEESQIVMEIKHKKEKYGAWSDLTQILITNLKANSK